MADEELTVENEILNNIGEGDEGQPEDNANEGEEVTSSAPASPEVPVQSVGNGKTGEQSTTPKPQDQQARGPQDLLDKDGKVIAKGGQERRYYETAQRLHKDVQKFQTENQQLKAKVEAFESTATLGTQYNLSPEELTTGAQIIAAYKSDPVATINHLLTQAQAAGHNIDSVGGGSVDMQSIKQMIAEAISPVTTRYKEETEATTRREEAQRTYNDFVGKYPDAEIHSETIAQLLRDDQNLSLDAAYFRLKTMYLERGLDWSKPLSKLQEEAQRARTSVPQQKPMIPSGRATSGSQYVGTDDVADVNTSMDDIVRQAMKEANLM